MHGSDWIDRRIWLFVGLCVMAVVGGVLLAVTRPPKMPTTPNNQEMMRRQLEGVGTPEEAAANASEMNARHAEAMDRARRAAEMAEGGSTYEGSDGDDHPGDDAWSRKHNWTEADYQGH